MNKDNNIIFPFNSNWKFFKYELGPKPFMPSEKEDFILSHAQLLEEITLPHIPKIEDKVIMWQWQGDCIYSKNFTAPDEWKDKKVFLRFEAVMNVAEVSVNGKHLLTHLGGYLPFTVDISKALNFSKENTILVEVDNWDNSTTGPKPLHLLDFNYYGGIYRDVKLIVKDPLYITDAIKENKTASGGILVTYPKVEQEETLVNVKTHIRNEHKRPQSFRVKQDLYFKETLVASTISDKIKLDAQDDVQISQDIKVIQPTLWSPQNPNLYSLKVQIIQHDTIKDEEEITIGIRHIELRKEGCWINGNKTFLRGVNRHQEYPFTGYAIGPNADYRDAKKIKEAGFDYVRFAHYSQSNEFLQACNELGILVITPILGWQYFNNTDEFKEHSYQSCRDMIRRDRNHPCILAWESSINETEMPPEFMEVMHKIVHEEHPSNQTYSAGWKPGFWDIFLQSRQDKLGGHGYTEPNQPYIVSEYGDWEYYAANEGLKQDDWSEILPEETSSRQYLTHGENRLRQQTLNVEEAHNDNFNTAAFADGYWVMFDYNRGYARDIQGSGLMSIDRIPKFAYYFYKSQRSPRETSTLYDCGPMVYIASWWTEEANLDVRVFSNAERVELFLNGISLGVQKPDRTKNLAHPPFIFTIDEFEKGTLHAMAYIKGEVVAEHAVITPEEPKSLELFFDKSGKSLQAGVNDVVFVYAKIMDKNNMVVPENGLEVEFTTEGDLEILNTEKIITEAGIATAVIRIGESIENASVSANATFIVSQTVVLKDEKQVYDLVGKVSNKHLSLQQ